MPRPARRNLVPELRFHRPAQTHPLSGIRIFEFAVRLAFACAFAVLIALPSLAAESGSCARSEPRADRLDAVDPRGELTLGSGRKAVLSGLRWPDGTEIAGQARAWLLERRQHELRIVERAGPDRWGRHSVDASADGADLAAGLVSNGLALADAGEADALCRTDLLALENAPREAGRGVWAQPVRDARDGAGLSAVEGDFVVAQGRIVGVGERGRRSYLNFSYRGEPGLSVTVTKRTWRIMQERGFTATTLKGRFVRVRGRVEVWRGPILDIASADMIEVLERLPTTGTPVRRDGAQPDEGSGAAADSIGSDAAPEGKEAQRR